MMDNALKEGAKEHAAVARGQLDKRFSGWDAARSKKGGAKQTVVTFRDEKHDFSSAKDAYVWLVERFLRTKPKVFSDPSDETLYLALGNRRNYFARSVAALFHGSPDLADNPNNYTKLSTGWFANVNLSNAQKFEILLRFGVLTELEYGTAWDWEVLDPTEELMDKQAAVLKSRELLNELRAMVEARRSAG